MDQDLNKIKKIVKSIKRLNLRLSEIEFVKSLIKPIIIHYNQPSAPISQGEYIYRGVAWDVRPDLISQLGSPPASLITTYQRTNSPHNPMFYASASASVVLRELFESSDMKIAVSTWKFKNNLYFPSLGYSEELFASIKCDRWSKITWAHSVVPSSLDTSAHKFANLYLMQEFIKNVSKAQHWNYKPTAAMAELIFEGIKNTKITELKFGGLIYPSVKYGLNGDNISMIPSTAEENLELVCVDYYNVNAIVNGEPSVWGIDFSNTFKDGKIIWNGFYPGNRMPMVKENEQAEVSQAFMAKILEQSTPISMEELAQVLAKNNS